MNTTIAVFVVDGALGALVAFAALGTFRLVMQGSPSSTSGVVTTDPLGALPVGTTLNIEPVPFIGADAGSIPRTVTNWTYFEGALLCVLVRTHDHDLAMGSAVMVAPGLAVTATHTFRDWIVDIEAGDVSLLCMGPSSVGCDLWLVRHVSFTDEDDITFLSLELASSIGSDWRVRTLPITTRAPRPGEALHVVGFRFEADRTSGVAITLRGTLFIATGVVTAIHHPIRDRVLMPYPVIEVACGSIGGMSGGALLDDRGFVLGLVGRGLATEDGQGPTSAPWIIGGLNRLLDISWPPGLYQPSSHVLDIDNGLVSIEGRERMRILSPTEYQYELWFDPPANA